MLQKIARGDVNEYVATVIEGWTFKRMRAELDSNPDLAHATASMSDAELLRAIGAPDSAVQRGSGEGLFFPDTYLFDKGTSDLNIYRRAYHLMQTRLDEAWASRVPGLPYKTPYEALTIASIVEKETGHAADRAFVAAVFANRLRIGMPLQTDPSVIYGPGDAYDGRLRKRDLQADTLQYLHPTRAAADADRVAGRGRAAGGDQSGTDERALFRRERRWHERVLGHARRPQQGRGQVHTRSIMASGKFITFEGIDGAGKTTHLQWFCERLQGKLAAAGRQVVVTREPGGTQLGEKLREILLNQPMDLETEALLMFAARREHLALVIEPALARGDWVVSDRFTDATFAYQGGGRGLPRDKLETLERWVQGGFQPDLTVLFDVAPQVASERRGAARMPDKFESESDAFFSRTRSEYLRRAEEAPHRFAIVDATQTIPEIRQQLERVLAAL